ncbi:unnamed protein product [Cyprideis torosa]|uniref:Uncharacterized protein n=1 Tax=Cyprideis torosa TaxID=163714 RepID=A0A7R8W2N4_9CRUS|nr:unnamed protein product [Cyprideis torosa]CAG0882046.1 unnamed protein product [Cyprideis torosa]
MMVSPSVIASACHHSGEAPEENNAAAPDRAPYLRGSSITAHPSIHEMNEDDVEDVATYQRVDIPEDENFPPDGEAKSPFVEKVRIANAACQAGEFQKAVDLYTEAIRMEPGNHVLFSNRSAAFVKLGKFQNALQDAIQARELNPKWPKAHEGKRSGGISDLY